MTKDERYSIYWKMMGDLFKAGHLSEMLQKLDKFGFFTAPASTKYHGNYEGGLFDHSVAVTNALVKLTEDNRLTWERKQSPYVIGLYHDLCKCDQYKQKQDGGYEYSQEMTLNGHGEKSVILAQQLLMLTDEEIHCIRWHMGAFDDKDNWNYYNRSVKKYPNVLYTHQADMIASQIEGV